MKKLLSDIIGGFKESLKPIGLFLFLVVGVAITGGGAGYALDKYVLSKLDREYCFLVLYTDSSIRELCYKEPREDKK